MPQLPIYMDNQATTRTDPRVLQAMLPYFCERFGNPASRNHVFGQRASEAVEEARAQIAELLGADARDIVFTSGATEANNLALKGAAVMYSRQGRHIISAVTEHHAVLDPCKRLQREGFDVTFLGVDGYGRVDPASLEMSITKQTILVSIMAANNEIGTLQPLAEIGRICKQHKVLFHTDAAQAVGKIPIDVEALQVDLLSLSGHKMYAPKGIGALYVRRRNPHVRLEPLFDGGGHERGLRSGTLPVPLIAGLGEACRLCAELLAAEAEASRGLRQRLYQGLTRSIEACTLNGHPEQRLPGNLNVSFSGVRGEALLMGLRDLAVSSGSACTSASVEPSYVLRAIGVPDDLAHSSLRFGLGRFNTAEEVDYAVAEVGRVVARLRALQPERQLADST